MTLRCNQFQSSLAAPEIQRLPCQMGLLRPFHLVSCLVIRYCCILTYKGIGAADQPQKDKDDAEVRSEDSSSDSDKSSNNSSSELSESDEDDLGHLGNGSLANALAKEVRVWSIVLHLLAHTVPTPCFSVQSGPTSYQRRLWPLTNSQHLSGRRWGGNKITHCMVHF